jgi:hypothetical protein
MKTKLLPCFLLILCGCSTAHDPFIIRDTTSASAQSPAVYPAHNRKVFLTQQPLPGGTHYELLETIEVGKIWYGSTRDISHSMADRARQIGADAVVEVKTWRQPSGFSWAAPHGSGKAVRFPDAATNNFSDLEGEWY